MAALAQRAIVFAILLAVRAIAQSCGESSWQLRAGQTIDVGSVTVSNDASNIYVTYTLDYQDAACQDQTVDAEFGTLHLWVGENLSMMPRTSVGNPIVGQFPYQHNATGLQSFTFTISGYDISAICNNVTLAVVPHAEVLLLNCSGSAVSNETAFGGDLNGVPPSSRWWYYGEYSVACCVGIVCVPSTWTLWAGQTVDVGTVSVFNDARNVFVTYTLAYQAANCPSGQIDAEFAVLHLWLGGNLTDMPVTDTGNPRLGQFPYQANATGLQDYTFTISLSAAGFDCDNVLYVVAHAEVNYICCDGFNLTGNGDTAFGGNMTGPTGSRWWFYDVYTICCPPSPASALSITHMRRVASTATDISGRGHGDGFLKAVRSHKPVPF